MKGLTLSCTHAGRSRFLSPELTAAPGKSSGTFLGLVRVSSSVEELRTKLLRCKPEMPLQEMLLPVSVFEYPRVVFPGR